MTELDIEIVERDNNIPPEKSILANREKYMTICDNSEDEED